MMRRGVELVPKESTSENDDSIQSMATIVKRASKDCRLKMKRCIEDMKEMADSEKALAKNGLEMAVRAKADYDRWYDIYDNLKPTKYQFLQDSRDNIKRQIVDSQKCFDEQAKFSQKFLKKAEKAQDEAKQLYELVITNI